MQKYAKIPASRLKDIRKLTQKKFRSLEGRFVVEGAHLVHEVLQSPSWRPEQILVTAEAAAKYSDILTVAAKGKVEVLEVDERELNELSETVTSQGIIAIVPVQDPTLDAIVKALPPKFTAVALDAVADPGNLGTILRTCDWFGVDAVILGKGSVDLYNPKVVRASMGAIFHLSVVMNANLLDSVNGFKREGARIVGTIATGGTPVRNFAAGAKTLLVFGSEARGISAELSKLIDVNVTIPGYGKA
ncbi:MAG TPA: RNA methyltransferase, partial [Bacteroidota bacterium]|nr:RNA methyltransferase [Bacteroidota bacterium]